MENTRKFKATVTTRYGLPEKHIYQQVLDLAKKNNLARSRAQLLLVERGLQHTNNPEPLIKEKVVYRDRPGKIVEKVVYKDRVVYKNAPKVDVSKGIQKDTPKKHIEIEHLTDTPKVDVSKGIQKDTPLNIKQDPTTFNESGWIGWCIAGIASILIGWKVAKDFNWL